MCLFCDRDAHFRITASESLSARVLTPQHSAYHYQFVSESICAAAAAAAGRSCCRCRCCGCTLCVGIAYARSHARTRPENAKAPSQTMVMFFRQSFCVRKQSYETRAHVENIAYDCLSVCALKRRHIERDIKGVWYMAVWQYCAVVLCGYSVLFRS